MPTLGNFQINPQTQISYETYGNPDKTPIVLIHDHPLNQLMWQGQVPALKENFYLITYDQRGLGKAHTSDPQYTFESYADDLMALLDHLKIKQAVVLGFSMGGYVALRGLEKNPERFLGLVLADTQSIADSDKAKLARAKALQSLKQDGLDKMANDFLEGTMFSPLEQIDLKKKLLGIINQNSSSGVASSLIAMATRTDTSESLSKITIPTLILVGAEDKITPLTAAQFLKDKIPGSILSIIPNAGHLSPLENEMEFNQALLAFLSKTFLV